MSEGPPDRGPDDARRQDPEVKHTDGRKLWDWRSKYEPEAVRCIRFEVLIIVVYYVVLTLITFAMLTLDAEPLGIQIGGSVHASIEPYHLAIFFSGCVGGTTFAMKWLIHAVATGRWHLDRRIWRFLIPLMGGLYACVVLSLLDGGFFRSELGEQARPIRFAAALAFIVGYFSDSVSALLVNTANGLFGTVKEK